MPRPQHPSMVTLVQARLRDSPRAHAYTVRDGAGWRELSWRDVSRETRAAAAGLVELEVRPGDRLAILADTGALWVHALLAAWRLGAVVVPVYPTLSDDHLVAVLCDAGCGVVIAEGRDAAHTLSRLAPRLPGVRHVVGTTAEAELSWVDLGRRGRAAYAEHPERSGPATPRPDDLALIVYTSGTTGDPKGVMLTHANLVCVCEGTSHELPFEPADLQLLFLPLSHVLGLSSLLVALHVGAPTVLEADPHRLSETLAETRPTFFAAVPRVLEKVLSAADARARARGPRAHAVLTWALRVAEAHSRARDRGAIPLGLRASHRLAERLVYRRIRAGLGGRLRALACGGAPLPVSLAHRFRGLGIDIVEGYGLTECAAVAVVNRLDDIRLGTVGRPGIGLDLRIAPDGEVLLRGPTVTPGYWGRPDDTADLLTDGWLHTGDLGRIDAEGCLHLVGRKKELIVTSGGKNIAPARIEAMLTAASPLVELAMVTGEQRPYLTALLALDPEALAAFAQVEGLPGDHAALGRHPVVLAHLDDAVASANAVLGRFETIKRHAVLPRPPSVEGGELTPSFKLRRDVMHQRHHALIDQLYDA